MSLVLLWPAAALAQPSGPARAAFDGIWDTTVTCAVAADGALGYTLQFPARVSNGALHGENGARGTPG